ncbi:MAG: pitrilysin family protein [Chloroflexota bacterium]
MSSLPNSQNITRVTLDNGVTILVYEKFDAASVVISGSLNVGALYETPAQNGLAALTASALTRGGNKRDFNAINEALEDIGADVDLGGNVNTTSFSGKSLAEDLPVIVDVLADVVRHPTFPVAQVERLRGEVLTGLQYRTQDTRYRAGRAFHEALYPANHPYHYSTRGSVESVSKITPANLAEFHKQFYGPKGMIFVVVGAVKAADAIEIVRAGFEDWSNPTQPNPPPFPELAPITSGKRVVVALPGKTQSDLVLGLPGPSRFSPDYQAASLVNSVLGQFGMMGRIGRSVREELGLAYYAYSQIDGGFGPGSWNVAAGVNPSNVDLAIDRIRDEIKRLVTEPVGEDDLADNQAYHVGHLPLQLESNEGIASSVRNMETYGLGLDYLDHYADMIKSLTRADLLNAAKHYLNPDNLVVGIAGPEMH